MFRGTDITVDFGPPEPSGFQSSLSRERGVQLSSEEVVQLLTQETINRWFLDLLAAGNARLESRAGEMSA
jgi:hypothetical protein